MCKNKDEGAALTLLVHKIAQDQYNQICDELEHLDPRAKWLIVGRVVSLLFAHHFQTALVKADALGKTFGADANDAT